MISRDSRLNTREGESLQAFQIEPDNGSEGDHHLKTPGLKETLKMSCLRWSKRSHNSGTHLSSTVFQISKRLQVLHAIKILFVVGK